MSDTETTTMITPSEVIEHIYCPRFTYYMNVLNIPQFEDRRFKVLKGREVHKRRETENRFYLRKKIGVVDRDLNVYLASPSLGVRGVVDEVLTLEDGSLAPLDYKYSPYREHAFKTHRIQIILYGLTGPRSLSKARDPADILPTFAVGVAWQKSRLERQKKSPHNKLWLKFSTLFKPDDCPRKTPHRATNVVTVAIKIFAYKNNNGIIH